MCAAFFFIALEYLVLSFETVPAQGLSSSLPFNLVQGESLVNQSHSLDILLCVSLGLLCFILAYMSESYLKWVSKTYAALQKSYPIWYQKISAPFREIAIALGFGALSISAFLLVIWKDFEPLLGVYGITATLGLTAGWLVLPVLRYRTSLVEDRPEKPPEALLQKVLPTYPRQGALVIGQIYLRLLMPFVALFLILFLPIVLQKVVFSNVELVLLFGAMVLGIGVGWLCVRESHLYIESFRDNFVVLLCGVSLAGILILFGAYSENTVMLFASGLFGGFFVSSY